MDRDFRVLISFFDHRKTIKLQKRLGFEAVLCLQRLWGWCTNFKADGMLNGLDNEDIAINAGWYHENFDLFVSTLFEVGYLDKEDDYYVIHDWLEHNPWAAGGDNRSDKARFSRLAGTNSKAHQKLMAQGVTAISRKKYVELTQETIIDEFDEFDEPSTNRQRTVDGSTTPTPTPIPEEEEEDLIISNEIIRQHPKAVDNCPHDEIIKLYHAILPQLPKVKIWGTKQQTALKARWREDKARQSLDWWKVFFEDVQSYDWLMGRTSPGWMGCNLSWLVKPTNMGKVLNGQYQNKSPTSTWESNLMALQNLN